MTPIELDTKSPPASTKGRCAEHDLATGPDGRCVLCRRQTQADAGEIAPDVALGPIKGSPGWQPPPSRSAGPIIGPVRGSFGLARAAFRLLVVMLAIFPLSILLWFSWKWSQLSDDERMDTGAEVLDAMERNQKQHQGPPVAAPVGQPYEPAQR